MLKVSVRKIKKKYNQTECLAHPTHLQKGLPGIEDVVFF